MYSLCKLALVLASTLALTACGSNESSAEQKNTQAKPQASAKVEAGEQAKASETVASKQEKLVVAAYNSHTLLQKSPLLKAMADELKERFAQREAGLNVDIKAFREDVEALKADEAELERIQQFVKSGKKIKKSASDKLKLLKAECPARRVLIEERDKQLTERRNALVRESNEFKKAINQQINGLISKALGGVAIERGLMLVHDSATGGVSFVRNDADITQAVLDRLNELWKQAGGSFKSLLASQKKLEVPANQ